MAPVVPPGRWLPREPDRSHLDPCVEAEPRCASPLGHEPDSRTPGERVAHVPADGRQVHGDLPGLAPHPATATAQGHGYQRRLHIAWRALGWGPKTLAALKEYG